MNQNNPEPAEARRFYYGIQGVPYAILDGGHSDSYRYDFSDLKSTPVVNYIGLSIQRRILYSQDGLLRRKVGILILDVNFVYCLFVLVLKPVLVLETIVFGVVRRIKPIIDMHVISM